MFYFAITGLTTLIITWMAFLDGASTKELCITAGVTAVIMFLLSLIFIA
jgi:hypothetical protein